MNKALEVNLTHIGVYCEHSSVTGSDYVFSGIVF